MADDTRPPVESILTDQERALTQAFQIHYAGEVRLAADRLGEALGLSEETKYEWIGRIAAQLDEQELDFEARRNIALGLTWLANTLSGEDAGQAVAFEPITVESEMSRNGGALVAGAMDAGLPAIPEAAAAGAPAEKESAAEAEATFEPAGPLLGRQRSWLGKIVPEEAVDRIEELPAEGRSEFARRLGDMYQQFKIVRNGPEAKRARAEQMIAMLEGEDYDTIAARHDAKPGTIRVGILNMAKSIARKIEEGTVTTEEIVALIPDPAELATPASDEAADAAPAPGEAPGEPEELPRAQRNWYRTLFTHFIHTRDTYTEKMSGLGPEQKAYLTGHLEKHLRAAIERREGAAKVERRVEQMKQLIDGTEVEEIARSIGLNEPLVKRELHASADTLQRQIPADELEDIIANTLNLPVRSPDAVSGS